MNAEEFKKLLFKSAVSVMAVDGEIHEDEIKEIKSLANSTAYFIDFEVDKELAENLNEIKKNGKDSINGLLKLLEKQDLSFKQETILIDVLIRVIEADKRIDENEIRFLHLIKSKLKTTEEDLVAKFPKQVSYLVDIRNYGMAKTFDVDINIK